mmetsp:Transcript_30700/g.92032  ORF Transcript_30700/g.92032 Transcript_30700/m.92032 type:complete len:534 (+) Transcript_30700:124-1725(+)
MSGETVPIGDVAQMAAMSVEPALGATAAEADVGAAQQGPEVTAEAAAAASSEADPTALGVGGVGGGGGGKSGPVVNPFATNMTRTSPATVVWLHENYEAAEGVSLGRSTLYQHYTDHCKALGQEPVNAASFGKLIRGVFPDLKTRRLGTRGNSKYHYYGIRVKSDSNLHFDADQIGGPHQRVRGRADGKADKIKGEEAVGEAAVGPELDLYFNTKVELPPFPPMAGFVAGMDAASDFSKPYHAHCKDVLKAVCRADFQSVAEKWSQFWGVIAAHFRDLFSDAAGIQHVDKCDELMFDTLTHMVFTDVLNPMPEDMTKEIRYFAKCMEPWIKTALEGYPPNLIETKLVRIRKFSHALRRYTSLNHLAQAAENVIQDPKQTEHMLNDIMMIDFSAITAQADLACMCSADLVTSTEMEFKFALKSGYTLRQWAAWMQSKIIQITKGEPNPAQRARWFLVRWSFYSSLVIRDLTLRSAPSFGSFHLMRLLYDEYLLYLIEQIDLLGVGSLCQVPAGCTRAVVVPFEPFPGDEGGPAP